MAVGNDQLAQFALEAPADERVRGKAVDRGLDRDHGILRGTRIFLA
jgi:hypothetical protein